MREIKFRAWNGSKLEYDVVVGRFGAFYGAGLDPKDSASFTPYNTIYSVGTPIMQYTGLKDKNGKEIFEGDVVKGEPCLMVVVSIYGGLSIHPIRNLGQKHNELIAMPTNDAQTASWLMETEIIGNIYENPELIGERK